MNPEYRDRLRQFVADGQKRCGSLGKFASEISAKLPGDLRIDAQLLHRWKEHHLKAPLTEPSLFKIGVALGAAAIPRALAVAKAQHYLEGETAAPPTDSHAILLSDLPDWVQGQPPELLNQFLPFLLRAVAIALDKLTPKQKSQIKPDIIQVLIADWLHIHTEQEFLDLSGFSRPQFHELVSRTAPAHYSKAELKRISTALSTDFQLSPETLERMRQSGNSKGILDFRLLPNNADPDA